MPIPQTTPKKAPPKSPAPPRASTPASRGVRGVSPLRRWQALPAWGTPDALPTEFEIFGFGANEATHMGGVRSTVYLSESSAKRVIGEYERRGIELAFDADHALGGESLGWGRLELRESGVWAVGIRWTDPGAIAEGKWRYTSPCFLTEQDAQGRDIVVEIFNVALTNYPATDNQRPLIAFSRRGRISKRSAKMTADEAKARASDIIALVSGDEAQADALALWLMEYASKGADPDAEAPPAEMATAPADIHAEQIRALGAQVDALLRARREDEIALLVGEGRLSPAQRTFCLALTPEQWTAYRSALPAQGLPVKRSAGSAPLSTSAPAPVDPGKEAEALAADDGFVQWCRRVGTDPKGYAETWTKKYPGVKWSAV